MKTYFWIMMYRKAFPKVCSSPEMLKVMLCGSITDPFSVYLNNKKINECKILIIFNTVT
jgi:hypothetical protein